MKLIEVYNDEKKDYFFKKTEVSKKYGYTPQQIGNILNGKTKKKYIVYDNMLYNIKYTNYENIKKIPEDNKIKHKIINDENNPDDFFLDFLNEKYKKQDDKTCFVKIKDIYELFILSNYYFNSEKSIREKIFTFRNMVKYFQKNIQLSYKKIYDKQENNERMRATNILFGYKLRE